LMKKVIDESGESGTDRQLLTRPKVSILLHRDWCHIDFDNQEAESKDPIRTGWATKEGAVVKSWKKRFFVVRCDYKIEYYDKEEVFT
jgi:hypothetical protein